MIDPGRRPHSIPLQRFLQGRRSIFCVFFDTCTDVTRDGEACARCQYFAIPPESDSFDGSRPDPRRGGPGRTSA